MRRSFQPNPHRAAHRPLLAVMLLAAITSSCMTVPVETYRHPETADIDGSPSGQQFEEKSAFVGGGVMFVPSPEGLTDAIMRDGWFDLYARQPRVVTVEEISLRAEGSRRQRSRSSRSSLS